jgi:hypothetical protein
LKNEFSVDERQGSAYAKKNQEQLKQQAFPVLIVVTLPSSPEKQ